MWVDVFGILEAAIKDWWELLFMPFVDKSLNAWSSYICLTVKMLRRFINGKGLSLFFPKKAENKYYPYNVVLFDLNNFYIGPIGTAPGNNAIGEIGID